MATTTTEVSVIPQMIVSLEVSVPTEHENDDSYISFIQCLKALDDLPLCDKNRVIRAIAAYHAVIPL